LIFATHGTTSFPFPCGCVEEGEEICNLLVNAQIKGSYESDQSFSVELKDHGKKEMAETNRKERKKD